jgi:hypothetical protein
MASDTIPAEEQGLVPTRAPRSQRARSYRFAVVALIILTGAWRLVAMTQWSWQADDWLMVARTGDYDFWAYLSQIHNGHLQPGQFAIVWAITALEPLNFSYAVAASWLLGMVSLVVWAVLFQRMFGDRWAAYIGLVPVALAPGFVPTAVWFAAALQVYSLQLVLGASILASLGWVRRGRRSSLVLTAVVFVAGLLLWEKSVLAIIPVMGVALLLARTPAGAVRWNRVVALGGVLGALIAVYSVIYIAAIRGSDDQGASWQLRGLGEVADFLWIATSQNLLPALSGGPVPSATQVQSGLLVPTSAAQWVITALALVLVMWGLARRRRAWIPLTTAVVYVAVSMGLVVLSTRFDFVGQLSALDPRYTADSLAVIALMGTLVLVPARGERGVIHERQGGPLRIPRWVMPALGVAVTVMALVTSAAVWDGIRGSSPRTWVDNVIRTASAAGDAAVVDSAAPAHVLNGYLAGDDALLSRMLSPLRLPLRFGASAPGMLATAEDGRILPAVLTPASAAYPGLTPDCGYQIEPGTSVRVPLTANLDHDPWGWGMQVNYVSTGDGTLEISTDTTTTTVPVSSGSNVVQLVVPDSIHVLTLSSTGPERMCVGGLAVGQFIGQGLEP